MSASGDRGVLIIAAGRCFVVFLLTSQRWFVVGCCPRDSIWRWSHDLGSCLLSVLSVSQPSWFSLFPLLADPPSSKQTLPLKVFLVTAAAIFGFTLSADSALLKFETRQRIREAAVRKEARMELAKQGLVPTETEIAKWREANGKQRN